MNHVIHTAYDGTITFKDSHGIAVAYAGAPDFIAAIIHERGWKAYGSPSADGYFLALKPTMVPEDLEIDPGVDGWLRLTMDDLLDFAS